MQRSKGKMQGTRGLRKSHRETGMPTVNRFMQEFNDGDSVHIDIVSSEPSGMPFPRFNGRTGVVKGKQGKSYKVEIRDGKSMKILLVSAVHLRKA